MTDELLLDGKVTDSHTAYVLLQDFRRVTLEVAATLRSTGDMKLSLSTDFAVGFRPILAVLAVISTVSMTGCATSPARPDAVAASRGNSDRSVAMLNRLTWGMSTSTADKVKTTDVEAFVRQQLHPTAANLPATAQTQIASMTISQQTLEQLVQTVQQQRKDADALVNDDQKKAAQQAYQQELNRLAREAGTRHILRALYSPNQVQEQMTWFWLNHFSVHQYKSDVRALLGDYEEMAIRSHALGKFKDLLASVALHPAMLRYLDNEQNADGHINENYARELMELHTLGVDGGYSQEDVQELARVLTGVGINFSAGTPNVKKELQSLYVRRGLFEFNPNRHDFGEKRLLGQPIRSRGLAELNEAMDRLARQPATARFISRKLATYWISDEPPARIIDKMTQTFRETDGDIAATLQTMFLSPEFVGRHKFKDPMRYVVSAVRLAYDDKPILNTGPILNWLNRMGEPLYGRPTPDGYPLDSRSWASPGQMATRFEIAKAIGSGSAGLFKTEGPQGQDHPGFPQLANALYYESLAKTLSPATKAALEQAGSPQEWNTFLLASPEFMNR